MKIIFSPLCRCLDYVCVYCRFFVLLFDWLCLIAFAHQEWKNGFWLPVCMHLYERGKHCLNPNPNLVRQLDCNFEVSLIHGSCQFFQCQIRDVVFCLVWCRLCGLPKTPNGTKRRKLLFTCHWPSLFFFGGSIHFSSKLQANKTKSYINETYVVGLWDCDATGGPWQCHMIWVLLSKVSFGECIKLRYTGQGKSHFRQTNSVLNTGCPG